MSQGHEICRNSAYISIRKPASQNMLSGTNEHEKEQVTILDIAALRTIGRIVRDIKTRIGTESQNAD